MISRLPMDANTEEEVWQYYQTRALQLASECYTWSRDIRSFKGGKAYLTWFTHDSGQVCGSFYVTADARNQGISGSAYDELAGIPIVTVADCHVSEFLTKKKIPFTMPVGAYDREAYKLVEKFYGDRKANRSQVFLMNHIDEGIAIMHWLGCDSEAIDAYALHPMLQGDTELVETFNDLVTNEHITTKSIALAMEYRNHANAWLSAKVTKNGTGFNFEGYPTSGPLPDVRDMLIADKVQNYKDFLLYHYGTHPRSDELNAYFIEWMKVLGVENTYQSLIDRLNAISPHN